ncbi:MAG: hypothetical protein WA667_30460 [Candidatus Nitrosopolaris sp.]
MNHKALAIAPIVAVAALVLTAVGFAIPQQAFAWGHHASHPSGCCNGYYPVFVPVPDNRIFIAQQINQENTCTKAICANEADNQANAFGFGFGR